MMLKLISLVAVAATHISLGAAATTTTTDDSSATAASITTTAASSTSNSSAAATYTVTVGIDNAFKPQTINADPGDTILFKFYPTNHSVVEAAFENPCIPLNYVYPGEPIFFSGNKQVDAGEENPVWTLQVNDTQPHFFYCDAIGSCITDAMIGVINPNSTFTLEKQLAFQKNVSFQLGPGEPWPAEAAPVTTSPGAAVATATSTVTSTATAAATGSSGGSSLSGGAIAGIAIGGAALLAIGVALIWFCGRKGGIEKGYRKSTIAHPAVAPTMIEANYQDLPKNSPQPSFPNSPFGPQHSEAYRSPSPGQWSRTGSPHNSYMQGYSTPGGLHSPYSDVFQPNQLQPNHETHGPVELPGNTDSPSEMRHEVPG